MSPILWKSILLLEFKLISKFYDDDSVLKIFTSTYGNAFSKRMNNAERLLWVLQNEDGIFLQKRDLQETYKRCFIKCIKCETFAKGLHQYKIKSLFEAY